MTFVICGFNYKSAPMDIREKLAVSAEGLHPFLSELKQQSNLNQTIEEIIILSTCNRTEFFCHTHNLNKTSEILCQWIAHKRQCSVDDLMPYQYTYTENDAIRHLLRVATGLDSMVLGEAQILGQLKHAYRIASQVGTVKSTLHYIFQFILGQAKNIRTHSGLNKHPVSIASIASQLIYKIYPQKTPLSILLIGSGETATLVAKYLAPQANTNLTIASRTLFNAEQLAKQYQAHPIAITDIDAHLPQVQVVISATSCPIPFLHYDLIASTLSKKQPGAIPFLLLDLAMPRNIEPQIATLPNVLLYNLDNLHQMIEQSMQHRQKAAINAEALLEKALLQYQDRMQLHRSHTLIQKFRHQSQYVASIELERARKKLKKQAASPDKLEAVEAILNEFSHRMLNKFLHTTTIGLRKAAQEQRCDLIDFAAYFYNLEHNKS